ncbi:MAG: STAS domain-containing protein [Sphingobacteriia bacterium]|nr:STAS domain-containing protein [Sphingobacteriia bacterium]
MSNHAASGAENAGQQPGRWFAALTHWLPLIAQVRTYQRQWLVVDVAAGLALGAILVPVGLAYAELAGLPAVTGLYASIACLFAYALVGPSRVLALGPDSSLSPLIFAAIIPLLAVPDPAQAIALASMLALMVGVIEIGLGLGRLGFVADLLSQEVQVGYMNGLAVVIIIGMLSKLFGISIAADDTLDKLIAFIAGLADTNPVSLAIGIGTLLTLLVLPRLTRKVPAVVVGVGGALLVTAALGLDRFGVDTIGVLPSGIPAPSWPRVSIETLATLVVAAFGIVLVSLADTIATSASFAARRGEEVDANRELTGVGVANVVTGLFQGFPISVSASRSAVLMQTGAKSQISNLVGATLLLALLILNPGLLQDLPQPALAAVVIVAALGLADPGVLRTYWRVRKSSLAISLVATGGVIVFGVLDGILIAVGMAVLLFFRRSWWPPGEVLAYDSTLDDWHSAKRLKEDGTQARGILVFRWEAPLFFANAGIFRQQLRRLVHERQPRWIVLQCEAITDIDVTAAAMLKDLDGELDHQGIRLAFVGMRSRLKALILDYGLYETLEGERFFPSIKRALGAMERRRKASSVFLCSPINAMDDGIYRQAIPLKTLREHGDFGIGIFDDLDGDLVMLDGRCFQVMSDGQVKEVSQHARTPFACVTDFEPISHDDLEQELDDAAFRDWLLDLLPSPNLYYALRIEGSFAEVVTSSIAKARPGEGLDQAQHRVASEVRGTLAGFYTPTFLKSLNRPGLQLSFLTEDRRRGGRLVSCRPRQVRARVQFITVVELGLPMSLGYLTWTYDESAGAYREPGGQDHGGSQAGLRPAARASR